MKKRVFFRGIILFAMGIAIKGYNQEVGDAAPDFTYTALDGSRISLSDYEGQVRVLYAFGNACPLCVTAGPAIETKIHQAFRQYSDFKIMGFDLWDTSSTLISVNDFKLRSGVTFPLLLRAGSLGRLYKTTSDRLIVIDRRGVIRFKGNTIAGNDVNAVVTLLNSLFSETDADVLDKMPSQFRLGQNFPNPFNAVTTIPLWMPESDSVTMSLFTLDGREVMHYPQKWLAAGKYQFRVNMGDLPSGTYIYRWQRGNGDAAARKMSLAK